MALGVYEKAKSVFRRFPLGKAISRKYKENNSVFRTSFLLLLSTILIPTCVLLSLQVYRVSQNAMDKVEAVAKSDMARASRNLDIMLDLMNQITLQTSLNPDMMDMLVRPFDKAVFEYALIKDQLSGWTKSNPLFQSIYLGILQNRRVLTTNEGIYDWGKFYDSSFMEKMEAVAPNTISPWVGLRSIKTVWDGSETNVLTFARTIPVTQHTPQGILVFNLRKDIFLNTLLTLQIEHTDPILIFDPENQLITPLVEGIGPEKMVRNLLPRAMKSEVVQLAGKKHRLFAEKLASSGFTIMVVAPYDAYNEQVATAVQQAVLIFAIVFVIGTALSYFLASIMYIPWRRLAERLQGFAQKQPTENRNAYTFVNHAIHDLIAAVRKNEPLVRDRMVQELLHDRIPEGSEVSERLNESGIRFVQPWFVVMIVSGENMDQRDNTANRMLYLYSLAEETLYKSFPSAGTILDNTRFGFILNLDRGGMDETIRSRIEECCQEIRRLADNRFQTGLFFCVSGIHTIDKLPQAYEQAKRTLVYKTFIPSDIYFTDRTEESNEFPYSAAHQKYILNAILSMDRDATAGYVSELFDRYLTNSIYSYPKLLQMILILMSHVISSLVQEGFDIAPLMREIDLLKLQQCRNRQELQQLIITQTGRVIDYLEASRERAASYGSGVQQAIFYIEKHFAANISIADIADSIGISASHLSRIFKAEVGKPPQEYLTEYRLNISKKLLADTNHSLNQIVEIIGYNDVHTFIRSFKKVEGTTPGEYRKRLINHF
jgi:two-component system response regulator YesN